MIRSGLGVEWVALAACAGVSEKFIHDRKLSRHAGKELEAELPLQPGSVLEQADRAGQRALELEAPVS